jgi:hypothetical protein
MSIGYCDQDIGIINFNYIFSLVKELNVFVSVEALY